MSRAKQNDPVRRMELCIEQHGRCFYCTEPMLVQQPTLRSRLPRAVTLDHLIPFCEGGRRGFPNEVAACNECNNRRGTMPWLLFYCLKELERARPSNHNNDYLHLAAGASA